MKIKLLSSLEKCFLDESIENKNEYKSASCLKNELFHFLVAYQNDNGRNFANLSVVSEISDRITVSRIEVVPVQMAAQDGFTDDYFLRKSPGLYPDILQPLEENRRLIITPNLKALMVEVDTNGDIKAGIYPITLCFEINETTYSETFTLEIINAELPTQDIIYTQWLHCDSLKDYYRTEAFDEKHWETIENFAKTAVRYGVNMLLTPIFTPPLDTYVGGERPTIQLVGVYRNNGKYSFDFSLLDRWVEMCNRIGVKYFEISHLFTQWGAKCAPKIMAKVDGEYKRIFGWETDALSLEYTEFLRVFIPAFLEHMKLLDGADKRCFFHVSDEPEDEHLENYLKAKSIVAPLLDGYTIMDASSNYEFYSSGVVDKPIVAIQKIEPYINNNVEDLWGYYTLCAGKEVSNRFIAMPSLRNRIIGTQIYKYNLTGFLHWGYNFYYNQFAYAFVNPFMNTDGEFFGSAGDAFSVYPGPDGKPWESIRLLVFFDALQDVKAFKLCEKLCGRKTVMDILDPDNSLTFKKYPHNEEYLLSVREKINAIIKNNREN